MNFTNQFEVITGLDGIYIVDKNKLVKLVKVRYSEDYFIFTGGWIEYELETGKIIRVG